VNLVVHATPGARKPTPATGKEFQEVMCFGAVELTALHGCRGDLPHVSHRHIHRPECTLDLIDDFACEAAPPPIIALAPIRQNW
jgi:hypothetical protein